MASKLSKPHLVDMPFSSFEFLEQSKPIVVFGSDGQVGRALQACLRDSKVPVVFLGRADCDLANESSILQVLNQYQPQVIINAAAYTAVDQAEDDSELVFLINAHAPKVMAHYIANLPDGILAHYSTDYIFADTKQAAYIETDITGPAEQLSVYGQSKLAGEQAIEEIFRLAKNLQGAHGEDNFSRYFILRTSWVYGDGDNFIRAILHLASERDQLEVVTDQVGVPTSAKWLAHMTLQLLGSRSESGIYHVVPDGETSWYDVAVVAIKAAASACESIQVQLEKVSPIPATHYPLPARRPYNSRMSNQKLKQALAQISYDSQYSHWQEQVDAYAREYAIGTFKTSILENTD